MKNYAGGGKRRVISFCIRLRDTFKGNFFISSISFKRAFTLAEILLTLGIIGVVAAMTLPSVISNYRKTVVESRLKKFYSTFSQAVKLAEVEYGEVENWPDIDLTQESATEDWFNTYLRKHMNVSSVERMVHDYTVWVKFVDGGAFGIRFANMNSNVFDMYFYPYAKDVDKCQRDSNSQSLCTGVKYFTFQYKKTGLQPYGGFGLQRSKLLDYCSGNPTMSYKNFCTGLIFYDGWQIKDDYPWF